VLEIATVRRFAPATAGIRVQMAVQRHMLMVEE
jgi:hypothetical protein